MTLSTIGDSTLNPLRMVYTRTKQLGRGQVVLLVDGSASINAENFEKLKTLCLTLVARLETKDTEFGLVQFSKSARVECPLTDDTEKFRNAVRRMSQLRQGSFINEGLQKSDGLFRKAEPPTEEVKRQIWLFTDGYLNDREFKINSLREQDVTITVIGIGPDVSRPNLEMVATRNLVFLANDMDHALEMLSGISILYQNRDFIRMQVYMRSDIHNLGTDVKLHLSLLNQGDIPIPRGSYVYFESPSYFHPLKLMLPYIAIGQKWASDFGLKCCEDENEDLYSLIDKLPRSISMKLLNNKDRRIPTNEKGFELDMVQFCGDVIDCYPSTLGVANILVLGRNRSGKSSLINSIFSTFSSEIQCVSQAGGTENRTTTLLKKISSAVVPGILAEFPLNFFDTPGILPQQMATSPDDILTEIETIVEGKLRPNQKVFRDESSHPDAKKVDLAKNVKGHHCPIHAIILLISPDCLDSEIGFTSFDDLITLYNFLVNDLGRPVIVVFSHPDTVPSIQLNGILSSTKRKLNVPDDQFFLLTNYSSGRSGNNKDLEIDKDAMKILMATLKVVKSYKSVKQ